MAGCFGAPSKLADPERQSLVGNPQNQHPHNETHLGFSFSIDCFSEFLSFLLQGGVIKDKQTVNLNLFLKEDAMGASKTQKLSGIQKQVLSLYRGFLRTARSKPPENRTQIESIVSAEFRRNSELIDRKNFLHIEYLLRRGKKQLDQLKTVDSVRLSSSNVDFSHTTKS